MKTEHLRTILSEFLEILCPTEEQREKVFDRLADRFTEYLTEEEAAAYLRIGVTKFRSHDIPFIPIDGRKVYAKKDLDSWMRNQPRQTGTLRARVVKLRRAA